MYPHSRKLLEELLREEQESPPIEVEADSMRAERGANPSVLQLQMKRKYHNNILRRMLVDAGYGDLARMSTIRRERLEDYEDG